MKKLISLFLAVLMIFSVASFAFAEGEEPGVGEGVVTEDPAPEDPAPEDPTPEDPAPEDPTGGLIPDLGEIEDMPLWQAKLYAKVAKIAVKLIVAFVKIGVKLGFIEKDDIVAKVEELVGGAFDGLPIDIETLVSIALI